MIPAKEIACTVCLGLPSTGFMEQCAEKPKHLAGSGLWQAQWAVAIQAFWQAMIPPYVFTATNAYWSWQIIMKCVMKCVEQFLTALGNLINSVGSPMEWIEYSPKRHRRQYFNNSNNTSITTRITFNRSPP